MKRTLTTIIAFFTLAFIIQPGISAGAAQEEKIQLAILLDTSNSMDGLINQAKTQLWKIVNELARARKNGKSPLLEVALYEYGKDSIPSGEGHLRMVTPLTTDLDRVSEELFSLTTNGGSEYCGMVIDRAAKGLLWSRNGNVYRVIFIAGNEPFTQGNVDYRVSVKNAIKRGIVVNTIFCGNFQDGVNTMWKHGAELADGTYTTIDHNSKAVHIRAPQDSEIVRLGRELNRTYIAYGQTGMARKLRQKTQDKNAAEMSESAIIERSVAKASKQYRNSGWDLVDAVRNNSVDLKSIDDEDMPEDMRKMSPAQRKAHIKKMSEKRASIQKKIARLNRERREYVEKKRKKLAGESTIDTAIIKTIRSQAAKKSYTFE